MDDAEQSMIGEIRNNLSLEEREAIADIFTKEYYTLIYFNGINYAAHLILQLFQNSGILRLLKNKYMSCGEIITEFNFISNAKYVLE